MPNAKVSAALAAVLLAAIPRVVLARQAPALAQFGHTAWTTRDGAPGFISALAQGADGALWIGSHEGLFRFDGLRFTRVEYRVGQNTTAQAINALLPLPDGSVWIGYLRGGVSLLRDKSLISFGVADGIFPGTVTKLARDSTNVIWASTTRGVSRLINDQWHPVDSTHGYPGGTTADVYVDRLGGVWLAGVAGVYRRPAGATRFIRRAASLADSTDAATGMVSEAPDGSMWGATLSTGLLRLSDGPGEGPPRRSAVFRARDWFGMLIDRDAHAWAMGPTDQLVRVALPDARGSSAWVTPLSKDSLPFTRSAGMSGGIVLSSLQDREGNVWLGTDGGLDRFRATKLTLVTFPRSVVAPVLIPRADGEMWVTSDEGSRWSVNERVSALPRAWGRVTSTSQDASGDQWIAGTAGAWRLHNAVATPVELPDDARQRDIQAIACAPDGTLWLSVAFRGVFRRRANTWEAFGEREGLGAEVASVIVPDDSGRTWLAYDRDRIAMVNGNTVRLFGAADSLAVGNALAILPGRAQLWVGGTLGLARYDGHRFISLTAADGPLRSISGIAEASDGALWLNGADGVTLIPAAEIVKALAAPAYQLHVERFDYRDGLDGPAPLSRPLPSVTAGTDGRLWFSSMTGVTWIDPRRVRRNTITPPVHILSATVDGKTLEVHERVALPARTTALNIAYSAVSLGVPDRVRYRYRLIGNDSMWQDVGTRREAIYTNLGPGAYRFQVIAANDDGIWNTSGAALDVVIPPTFMQSRAFLVLCVLASLGAVWGLAAFRQRQVAAALQARFDATLAERTRIAQELHDTLLQGFTSVSLQVQVAHQLVRTRPDDAAAILQRTVEGADVALREARYGVWDMRAPEIGAMTLPDAFRATALDVTGGSLLSVQVSMTGTYQRLTHAAESAALRIVREALTNVVKHAEARTVSIDLAYEARALCIRISDDGKGIGPDTADAARRRGHWGVVGMRERAVVLGGRLEIGAAPRGGTMVTLTLPLRTGR